MAEDTRTDAEKTRDNLATVAAMLYNDAETRGPLEALVKKKWPGVEIAGHDAREATRAAHAEREALAGDRKRLNEHLREIEHAKAWAPVLDAGIIRREDIAEVESLMAEKLVGDPMLAAREWRRLQTEKLGVPRSGHGAVQIAGIHDQSTDYFKALGKAASTLDGAELDRVARAEGYRVLDELITTGRAGG